MTPAPAGRAPSPQVLRDIKAAMAARQFPRAEDLARRALDEGAVHPQLLYLRATWLRRQDRAAEALADLEQARALDSKELAVLMELGLTLAQLNRRVEARRVFEQAAALRPDLVGPALQVGWVSENLGDIERARIDYAAALEVDPANTHALARLATIAAQQGDWAEARARASRALAINPAEAAADIAHIRADVRENRLPEAETRILALLGRNGDLDPDHRHQALQELGALRHLQGRHAEAFEAWKTGNEAAYRKHAWRFPPPRRIGRVIDEVSGVFAGDEPWAASPGAALAGPARNHVFLLGFARSGTTLLEQVIAGHPDVVAMEEKEVLTVGLERFWATAEGLAELREATDAQLAPMREIYWREVATLGFEPAGKTFMDKSPFNALRLPLIARLFPDAKVLFALRDPRDVVLSCFRTPFRTNVLTFELLRIEDAGRFYGNYMRMAERFRRNLPLRLMTIRHEDLLDDIEGKIAEVCEFIGIDLRAPMLDFAASGRRVATPSAHQLKRGLTRASAGQWRRYASEMAPALPHLAPWVTRFGYEP